MLALEAIDFEFDNYDFCLKYILFFWYVYLKKYNFWYIFSILLVDSLILIGWLVGTWLSILDCGLCGYLAGLAIG